MNLKIFYLLIIFIACFIQMSCSQEQPEEEELADEEQSSDKKPYIEVVEASYEGENSKEGINDVLDEITNNLFSKEAKTLDNESSHSTTTVATTTTREDRRETVENNLKEADEEEEDEEEHEDEEQETQSKPVPTTTIASVTSAIKTSVQAATTPVVAATTATQKVTPVPQQQQQQQQVQTKQTPQKAPTEQKVNTSNNNQNSGSHQNANSNSKPVANNNKVVANNISANTNANQASESVTNNAIAPNAIQNMNVDNNTPAEPQYEEQPIDQTQGQVFEATTMPMNQADVNSGNDLAFNVDGQNNESNNKKSGNKLGLSPLVIKIGIGIAAGAICIVGLLVGKTMFGKKSDKDVLPSVDNSGRNVMGLEPNDQNYSLPGESYSQKLQPNNYLNPNIINLPTDNPPSNDFINPNSIEPLPNLVNKVDVELPIYNIQEEHYNTIGRQLEDSEQINTWNDEEITDETKLLGNKDGYNNIVPEMGEMVIENNNRPSLYAAIQELEKEDGGDPHDSSPDNNMKQIIPDIQYATVESNNNRPSLYAAIQELEKEDGDGDGGNGSNQNSSPNNNMKQIIPDIQYATVETNNNRPSLYAAIQELEKEDDGKNGNQNSSPNNNMKQIIPDIQYATVEVNNEFENIDVDENELNNQPGMENMKQIVPDIQYATVEVNNEFAGIDEDSLAQRASIVTVDTDIQEVRASEFLEMPNNLKDISDTYRNALRGTFNNNANRDTLNSTESILHKLR